MTTPNEELIARLRDRATFLGPELTLAILQEAADLLQSQAERIATLEDDVEYLQEDINAMCNAIPSYRWSGGAAELIAECFAERDTLRTQLADAELHTKQVERGLDKATAQLAEIEKTEPVGWFDVRCEGCGYITRHREHMGCVCAAKQHTRPMPAQDVKDAERYRWLREQHWSTDTIAVVLNPKQAVKLGYVCPSDSLLDETIDAAITKGAK